jgi:hypothetical protein
MQGRRTSTDCANVHFASMLQSKYKGEDNATANAGVRVPVPWEFLI